MNKLVEVIWKDATYYDEQVTGEDAMTRDLITITTVGHLIGEREDCLVIAMEASNSHESYRHVTMIPKVNVVKKRRIK